MMLNYCLSLSKARDGDSTPYPVLSVPSFASSSYLHNISLSMQIAGISQYATLHSSLAVALNFAYYQNKNSAFSSYSSSHPYSLLLIDVGFFSLECSLFFLWQDHMERRAFSYRMDCGGDRCTHAVLSIITEAYARLIGPFPKEQSKVMLDYYFAAERVKHNLSLEGLDDVTIPLEDEHSLTITVEEVERAVVAEGLLEDTVECIFSCVEGVDLPSIDRMECVGGASRAPYVRKALEAVCSRKGWQPSLRYTLNPDEACASGCTLYAVYKAAPDECTEKALLECVERMNVPPQASEESMFVRAREEVVEEGRAKEESLRKDHHDYEKKCSALNRVEERLLSFQSELEGMTMPEEEKKAVGGRVSRMMRELTRKGMAYSILQYAFIEGMVQLLINTYNGKTEELEVFRIEGERKRCVRRGAFKNGKQNGIGSFHDQDELRGVESMYEGGFENGLKSGRGELMQSSPECAVFEVGEFKADGLVEGTRIEYRLKERVRIETVVRRNQPLQSCVWDDRGNVLYRGGIWKGKKEGYGISYYPNGCKQYEGLYRQGLREGEGVSYTRQGCVQYEGRWSHDEIETGAWRCLFPHSTILLCSSCR